MVVPSSNSIVSPAHAGLDTSATAAARPVNWKLLLLFLLITLALLISDPVAASMGSSVIALHGA